MTNSTGTTLSPNLTTILPPISPSTLHTTSISTTVAPAADEMCIDQWQCLIVFFLLSLIIFMIMLVAFRMCCIYMVLRRRMPASRPSRTAQRENETAQRDIEDIGHPFSYLAHEGFDNNAFVAPPPRYEELFKGDEPPPMYENVATQAAIQDPPRRNVMQIERPLQTSSSQPRNSVRSQHSQTAQSTFSANLPVRTSLTMLPTGAFGTSIPPPTNEFFEQDFGSFRLRGDTVGSVAQSLPPTYMPPITMPRNDTIFHQTTHSTDREDHQGSQYFDAVEPVSQERLV